MERERLCSFIMWKKVDERGDKKKVVYNDRPVILEAKKESRKIYQPSCLKTNVD